MTQQFTIIRLGHQGDGIADGPVYAPRTLPGEVVSGTVLDQFLTDIRVETPSDQRIKAPCRHYKACGGCQLQHASDDFVAGWKVDVVRNALAAQGLDAPMRPIHTSPERSRRRATIAVRRTKKGTMAGFHGRASDTITEISDCHLLEPALIAAVPVAEALAAPPRPLIDVIPTAIPGVSRSLRPLSRPEEVVLVASLSPAAPAAAQPAAASVTELDPEGLATGTRLVQLGAFDDAETAREEWVRLARLYPDFFRDKDRVVQRAVSGGRAFFRLRAHGFDDLSDARRFCTALNAQGAPCIPVTVR